MCFLCNRARLEDKQKDEENSKDFSREVKNQKIFHSLKLATIGEEMTHMADKHSSNMDGHSTRQALCHGERAQ